jgi:hypothetical protein
MIWDASYPRDYVTLLAESDKKRGVTYRHTSWTREGAGLDAQEQARISLAMDWATDRGHHPKLRTIDGIFWNGKVRWNKIWPATQDIFDRYVAKFRRWRDRGKNPYGEF